MSPQEAVQSFLARLTRPTRILVGVSGGSDSIGLLLCLHEGIAAGEGAGHELVAATVDHELRAEAAGEARLVARLCKELSVAHETLSWSGEKPKSGISAASREARYRLLMQSADSLHADVIVTGHTLDDQIETIAMRAARSDAEANLGLAGMAEAVLLDRRCWLLRPFLATRREAIREFLRERGRAWIDDPSNADRHYERVRVRIDLKEAGEASLADLQSAALRRVRLSEDAAEIARRYLKVHHGVLAELSPEVLNEDRDTLRHLLATLAAVLGGRQYLPAATTMTRVMAMLDGQRMGRTTAGRVIFDLRRQGLFMHREARDLPVVHVGKGKSMLWDGRYRLANETGADVTIIPTPPDRELASGLFADVPVAIAQRAMGVMPYVEVKSDKASVIVEPLLAPFDCFLPQFEVSLALELGLLLGCKAFPSAPIKVFERKS